MKYILSIGALGTFPEITIDRERFLNLKASRAILTVALALEEKYEILISNYVELERESINHSVSGMVRNYIEYTDFFNVRLALNIRMVNLMTSARLYTDQLASHLSGCLPKDTDINTRAKKLLTNEYDKSFDYRFMEALRNHVQHSGTPIHRVSINPRSPRLNDDCFEYSLYFATQKDRLQQDGKFKASVLNEMPNEVNLTAVTRSYIESISTIHCNARELIGNNVREARELIEAAINEYKSIHNEHAVGLRAYVFNAERKVEEIGMFLDWDDVRLRLEKRNKHLAKLARRYPTGKTD